MPAFRQIVEIKLPVLADECKDLGKAVARRGVFVQLAEKALGQLPGHALLHLFHQIVHVLIVRVEGGAVDARSLADLPHRDLADRAVLLRHHGVHRADDLFIRFAVQAVVFYVHKAVSLLFRHISDYYRLNCFLDRSIL